MTGGFVLTGTVATDRVEAGVLVTPDGEVPVVLADMSVGVGELTLTADVGGGGAGVGGFVVSPHANVNMEAIARNRYIKFGSRACIDCVNNVVGLIHPAGVMRTTKVPEDRSLLHHDAGDGTMALSRTQFMITAPPLRWCGLRSGSRPMFG